MENDGLGKIIIAGIIIGVIWLSWIGHKRSVETKREYTNKQHAERVERLACDRGEYCSDFEGWRRSYDKNHPVKLPTGNYYFQGRRCEQTCEGHVAGYEWAKSNEIINFNRCSTDSPSFNVGCELGVIEIRVKYGLPE